MYSNIQLTLDNPAILEQKLEALEHHKRVLENQRRAQLNASSGQHHSGASVEAPPPDPPSLATHPDYARSFRQTHAGNNGASSSSSSAPNGTKFANETIYANQQQMYQNLQRTNDDYPADSDDDQPQLHTSNYANYRNVTAGGGEFEVPMHGAAAREPSSLIYGNVKAVGNNTGGGLSLRGVMQPSQAELVNPYSNYSYTDRRSQGISSLYVDVSPHINLVFSLNAKDELPPPPLEIPAPLNLLHNDYQPNEDDLPPPPSPVSSSYSELRRATDNTYPTMPNYSLSSQNNYQHLNNMQQHGGGGHPAGGSGHHNANGGGDMHPSYANNYATDYGTYAPSLQGSSTYESIYEPINPRPPSQMSSRSNYSLYNPYVSGPQGAGGVGTISVGGGPAGGAGKKASHKETEVDILTDLLVQSMDGNQDSDSYGDFFFIYVVQS